LASDASKKSGTHRLKNKSQWLNKTKKHRKRIAYFLSNPDRPIKIQYLATLSVIYPHSLWITFLINNPIDISIHLRNEKRKPLGVSYQEYGPADRNRTCIPRLGGMCTIHCATARLKKSKTFL